MRKSLVKIPVERIEKAIFLIRSEKVMLDRDLAILYGVTTSALKQAVRRNMERFPEDFMFVLRQSEFADWRSQIVISNADRKRPSLCPNGVHRAGRSDVIKRVAQQTRHGRQRTDYANVRKSPPDAGFQCRSRKEAEGAGAKT